MPIYEYICECGCEVEEIQKMGSEAPVCPKCGVGMIKKPTHPSMVKWKGEGGFPSLRKQHKGTAPYTSQYGEYGD